MIDHRAADQRFEVKFDATIFDMKIQPHLKGGQKYTAVNLSISLQNFLIF